MRFFLIFMLFWGMVGELTAERQRPRSSDEPAGTWHQESLFDINDCTIGGFGGPEVYAAGMNSSVYCMVGGQGGLIVDHQLLLGGFGAGCTQPVTSSGGKDYYLGQGGLFLGWIFYPQDVFHAWIKGNVGAAGIVSGEGRREAAGDTLLLLEPTAGIQVNLTSWMRLSGFGGYHWLLGSTSQSGLAESALRGWEGGVSLDFGFF